MMLLAGISPYVRSYTVCIYTVLANLLSCYSETAVPCSLPQTLTHTHTHTRARTHTQQSHTWSLTHMHVQADVAPPPKASPPPSKTTAPPPPTTTPPPPVLPSNTSPPPPTASKQGDSSASSSTGSGDDGRSAEGGGDGKSGSGRESGGGDEGDEDESQGAFWGAFSWGSVVVPVMLFLVVGIMGAGAFVYRRMVVAQYDQLRTFEPLGQELVEAQAPSHGQG